MEKQEDIQRIIVEKGLRPLGNKMRLTWTENKYNVRLLLFANKNNAETYYNEFLSYAQKDPPPFPIEIMLVRIQTIYVEPFGLVLPYERTDIRPKYVKWHQNAILSCNERLRNYQAADHSYQMLNQYIKELFKWTILVPEDFNIETKEANDILSDPPDNGYYFSLSIEKSNNEKKKPTIDEMILFKKAIDNSDVGTIRKMLSSGFDPNTRMDDTKYPIILATERGNIDIITELLKNGANVNSGSAVNATAINCAAYEGYTEILKLLLNYDADPNVKLRKEGYGDGMTPLMQAAYRGKIDCIRLLIEKGADVKARTKDNKSALILAKKEGHTDCVEFLLSSGAEENT